MKTLDELDQATQQVVADETVLREHPQGWIKAARSAIGMSLMQLARRLDITHPALLKLEEAERDGRITLNKLRTIADAMDCDVVYGFVPRSSFRDLVNERAEATKHESKLGNKNPHERRDLWDVYSFDEVTPTRGGRRQKLRSN